MSSFPALAAICLLFFYLMQCGRSKDNIPTVRCCPSLFPEYLDRLWYNTHARRLILYGYRKYHSQPFRLLKLDMDLIVVPLKYASELRAVTSDRLDPLTASFDDNAGSVTKILLGSELHTHAIQRRLTPRLPQVLPIMMDELKHAFYKVLADAEDGWIPISPYEMVLNLSTRASARVFVGDIICRDEVFLETTASFSRNTFDNISTARWFGSLFTTAFGRWIPAVREAHAQLHYIQQLLGSEVARRRKHPDEQHDDFLQWCMDLARTEEEAHPLALAHRTVGILSMAVVHTTAMATTHVLFDMIADKDLQNSLRAEQESILKGGWAGITQQDMLDMKQLDSLMRESQRINPVGEFTFRRVVKSPIVLSDGYELKPGQQIGIPARCINTDEGLLHDAESFTPSRWLKQTDGAPTSFSNSGASNLHFGLGRYACPGRFLAAYAIKAIVSRFLLEYDFKLQDESVQRRPSNLYHGDKILPNREAVILVRRRRSLPA